VDDIGAPTQKELWGNDGGASCKRSCGGTTAERRATIKERTTVVSHDAPEVMTQTRTYTCIVHW